MKLLNPGKIIRRIRRSYWIKSASLVLITRVLLMSLGFLGFLIFIRLLDKETYGIWVIFITITSMIETLRLGFLKSPLIILNSDKSSNIRELYNSTFLLNMLVSATIGTALVMVVLGVKLISGPFLLGQLLLLYIIKLFITAIGDYFDILQEANLNFKGTFFDLIARNTIFILLVVGTILFGYSLQLEMLVIYQIIGASLGAIFSFANAYFNIKELLTIPNLRFRSSYLQKFLHLGKYTLASSATSITMRNIDTWMLGVLISPMAVAIYNPALRLSNIFEIPSTSMSTILLPKLSQKVSEYGTSSIKYYYEKSLTYIMMFMVPVIIVFTYFAEELILLVAGPGFEQSVVILKITMLYGLFIPFNRQFSVILESLGKPKVSFIIIAMSLGLMVILNYLFIIKYGIIGAAYGSLLTYFVIFLITQIYLYSKFSIQIWNILIGIVPAYLRVPKHLLRIFR